MPKFQIMTRFYEDQWECPEEFPTIYNTHEEAMDELESFTKECQDSVSLGYLDDFNPRDWKIFEIMDDKMSKEFECFWGAGYRKDDLKSTLAYHPVEFFNTDNGYEQKDINSIGNLYVGENYDLDGVFCEHWIRRIK
jgi:hypothetical protein